MTSMTIKLNGGKSTRLPAYVKNYRQLRKAGNRGGGIPHGGAQCLDVLWQTCFHLALKTYIQILLNRLYLHIHMYKHVIGIY